MDVAGLEPSVVYQMPAPGVVVERVTLLAAPPAGLSVGVTTHVVHPV